MRRVKCFEPVCAAPHRDSWVGFIVSVALIRRAVEILSILEVNAHDTVRCSLSAA